VLQPPAPSQTGVASVLPEHEGAPHEVPAPGYWHAPVPKVQLVAPQAPTVLHVAAQQTLFEAHTPDWHAPLLMQKPPFAVFAMQAPKLGSQ